MENVEKNKGRNDEKRAAPRCNEDKCTDAQSLSSHERKENTRTLR